MNLISIILVLIVAFLAGLEGILDSFQFHQPLVACTLIGLATGHVAPLVMLGGALQLMALGWANIGAAVAPDAALASVASSIIFVQGGDFSEATRATVIGVAIALATAGLVLTMAVRTLAVVIVHQADRAAAQGSYSGVQMWHFVALLMQGLRIAIPAGLLVAIPADAVQSALEAIPGWFSTGMAIGGGMVVAVGYAMVINMMASREVWPFFFIGFALAPLSELTLIAMGIIGVAFAFIYMNLENKAGSGGGVGSAGSGDPIGDILDDY